MSGKWYVQHCGVRVGTDIRTDKVSNEDTDKVSNEATDKISNFNLLQRLFQKRI